MNYIEYGREHDQVIVLLHGGGLSWWNYRDAAEKLSSDYRIVLPILDGHANSCCDFVSIEETAARMIALIDDMFGGSVLLLGGLSLGGQIALEILSQKKDICQYAVIESALVLPSKMMHAMIKPAFGSCYGLIKRRWFSRLQFKSLRIKQELFETYFRDTCTITKSNMIAFLEANALYELKPSIADCSAKVCVLFGEKERSAIRKSAEIIHEKRKGSLLQVLPKLYHGEFSINHADAYVNKILDLISGRELDEGGCTK